MEGGVGGVCRYIHFLVANGIGRWIPVGKGERGGREGEV